MPNLQITDEFGLNANIQIQDASPLAKAKISHITSVDRSLKEDIDKPVDQTSLSGFSFGMECSAPNTTIEGVVNISAKVGACGAVSIVKPSAKTLFANDTYMQIGISSDQCWIGIELDESIDAGAQAKMDGFGAQVAGSAAVALTTYTLLQASDGKFPALLDGLKAAFDGFYLASSAAALRALPVGAACASEVSGTVTFTGSYQVPVTVNALASAGLPMNYKLSVQPEETLKLSGCISLSGDLIVRSHKFSDQLLDLGIYKKKGSTLTVGFTAAAGIGIDEGSTDLASLVLSTAIPGATAKSAGITGANAAAINSALNSCIDHSLSLSVNASCSAAASDQAAVVYRINLGAGSADETNAALKAALRGDWTLLSQLGNAQLIRNVVTDSREYKQKLAINLFGIYNAVGIDDYIQSCTILRDGNGQISVIDKADERRITTAATPDATDPDKLRKALAQDFLCTATYAMITSKVQQTFAIQQSYFLYSEALSRQKMHEQILLGSALKLINSGPDMQFWNTTISSNAAFPHAQISASAKYGNAAVLNLFFADAVQLQPRTRDQLERAGRIAMIALIDPDDPVGRARVAALENDDTWNAMDANGNTNAFGQIPQLTQFQPIAQDAIGTDWTAIAWWADSMSKIAPELSKLLALLDTLSADDFNANPAFKAQNSAFQKLLASLLKNTHASFADGWGLAVVYALAGNSSRIMDIAWTGGAMHYESNV